MVSAEETEKVINKIVGHIIKSYIFATPLKKEALLMGQNNIADVAQLARARDL